MKTEVADAVECAVSQPGGRAAAPRVVVAGAAPQQPHIQRTFGRLVPRLPISWRDKRAWMPRISAPLPHIAMQVTQPGGIHQPLGPHRRGMLQVTSISPAGIAVVRAWRRSWPRRHFHLPPRSIVKGTLKTGRGYISCSLRALGSPKPQHCEACQTPDRSWLSTIYPCRWKDARVMPLAKMPSSSRWGHIPVYCLRARNLTKTYNVTISIGRAWLKSMFKL